MSDIKTILVDTKRPGIKNLIKEMENREFFTAPCSGGNHLCQPGGLAEHSANVTETAIKISKALAEIPRIEDVEKEYDALLTHKDAAGFLLAMEQKKFFSLQCRGKRHNGLLAEHLLKTAYAARAIAQAVGYENIDSVTLCALLHDIGDVESASLKNAENIPDAIRTILVATRYFDITEEEEWAMLTHDALYGDMRAEFTGHETPLALIIHWAELWALRSDEDHPVPDVKSVALCAVIHDLGKTGDFGKELYVPNILKSGKPSAAKPYKRNPELTNIPHAIRSVKIAERFIDLSENEKWAILAHDGLYDFMRPEIIGHETPLSLIIHMADMWSSHVIESEGEEGEEE